MILAPRICLSPCEILFSILYHFIFAFIKILYFTTRSTPKMHCASKPDPLLGSARKRPIGFSRDSFEISFQAPFCTHIHIVSTELCARIVPKLCFKRRRISTSFPGALCGKASRANNSLPIVRLLY